METKTNIFFHAPKELTTDAFLVWFIYFLDSDKKYRRKKQLFFDRIILKKEDCGRKVCQIELKRQENNVDVLLSFYFEDSDEKQMVLFEDKIWSMPHSNQLALYRKRYPNCYRYFYYKLGYINTQEEQEVTREQYDIINAGMMSAVTEKCVKLHPLIKMYDDYITYTFGESQRGFYEKLFVNHDYDILWDADAQKYLCDTIVENMTEQQVPYLEIRNGSSFGRPWTQIDIAEKKHGYWEKLFWRVDIRSGKFYVRLNQYAEPSKDEVPYKTQRLEILRKEANNLVANMPDLHPGKVHDRAVKESEVVIFFLEDNNLETLIEAIPKISSRMIKVFKNLETR